MANPGRIAGFLKIAVSKGFLAATETWVITHYAAWVATGLAAFFVPHQDLHVTNDGFLHLEWVGISGVFISVWYILATYFSAVDRCRNTYRLLPLMAISLMLGIMAFVYSLVSDDLHIKTQMLIVWFMSLYLIWIKLHNVAFIKKVDNDIKKRV